MAALSCGGAFATPGDCAHAAGPNATPDNPHAAATAAARHLPNAFMVSTCYARRAEHTTARRGWIAVPVGSTRYLSRSNSMVIIFRDSKVSHGGRRGTDLDGVAATPSSAASLAWLHARRLIAMKSAIRASGCQATSRSPAWFAVPCHDFWALCVGISVPTIGGFRRLSALWLRHGC